ncbi:MAG: helix-turn-helix domain-containing protein [Deltaproteobacteria bacterium]|nr:helix-turn-helix domain-containing protein [Deltaproteobacteria bacterium]
MEGLLTPKEAAKIMAVTSRTIKEWLRRGELTGVKIKNMWRVRESDLERFIQKGSEKSSNASSPPPFPRGGEGGKNPS